MDYKSLATSLLTLIGGKENVDRVVHCATRLRFTLKDDSKAKTDEIKKTKGVLSVVNAGGQYQIVIGPDVPQVYQEVIALGNFEASAAIEDKDAEKQDNRSKFSKILEGIASIFQPIIPAITGAGLLKAIMALCSTLGWLKSGTQTYIILNAMADSAFYFLPILLAQSCAKKFRCNQGTAMALGGLLVYPNLTTLMTEAKSSGEAIKFLGFIPIQAVTAYASSVIPIILGVWFMSLVEHLVQKYCPKAIKFFFVPFLSLFIGGTVTLCALGPIGTWVSGLIQAFFTWLKSTASWLVPTVVGAVSPLLVMTGTHYGLIPIGTNNLTTAGHDAVVGPGMLVSNTAQGAAGLAVFCRSKNPDTKQLASSAGITGLLGITEPVLYGINLRFTFPLYAAMIGGAVGGLYLGITGVERFGAGSPGLLVLPVYLPTEAAQELGFTMANMYNAVIGVIIAVAVSFIACWIMWGIWAKKGKLPAEELGITAVAAEAAPAAPVAFSEELASPLTGEVVALKDIPDEVFASGALGQGVGILPSEGKVVAPCSGTITTLMEDSKHAVGMVTDDGKEILIHVGLNTVEMGGKAFDYKVKMNDRVTKGQLLLTFDIKAIQDAGYKTYTPVLITNTDDFASVAPMATGTVKAGAPLIRIKK